MKSELGIVSKNIKYSSGNPISRLLIDRFTESVQSQISSMDFDTFLEVGCGEGLLLRNLLAGGLPGQQLVAIDIDHEEVAAARMNLTSLAECTVADICNLPFMNDQFEMVLCAEVLEHLKEPEFALAELRRVCREFCLISVPDEPLWRILNMVRGAYWSDCGNTPGHMNHWNSKSISELVSGYFEIIRVKKSIPWIIILAKKKSK